MLIHAFYKHREPPQPGIFSTCQRSHYREVLWKNASNEEFDLYQLTLHLHFEHEFVESQAFAMNIRFSLSPNEIDKKEYKYMRKVNTFQPHGTF